MKKILALFTAVFLSALASYGQFRDQNAYNDLYDSEIVAAMKAHVRELSSAALEGRKAGSQGEQSAAGYIGGILSGYGVEMLTPVDGELFGIRTESGDTLTSRNVAGIVQGYDKELRDRYIVVGARLDNLGTMITNVDGKPMERIYYGANGNASGLSMLLELARMVSTNSILFRRSVIFVAFGASSHTYAGSWYFLNRSFKYVDKIDAMINLDMLGTGYNGFYAYTASNEDLNTIIRTISGELQPIHPEIVSYEPYPSDHRLFYSHEIPSVYFTTGRYPQHNTDKDTQSIIDWQIMERELEYIYNFTLALANAGKIVFRPSEISGTMTRTEGAVPYFDCDQRPQFFGNSDLRYFLREWVYQYLKYPQNAVKNGVQGTVTVEFVIEKDGKVTGARVLKGVDDELDAEALKVVSASPKWKPGRVGASKVRAVVSVPVEFRLEKKSARPSFGIKK